MFTSSKPGRLRIDAFALCSSAFAAPLLIALFGLLGLKEGKAISLTNLLFWQFLLAATLAPMFVVITWPLCWLVVRISYFAELAKSYVYVALSIFSAVFIAACNVPSISLQATFPGAAISWAFGVLVNVSVFLLLNRKKNSFQ